MREASFQILNSIFELAKTLVNNIHSPKPKLHFPLHNMYFNFYLSTNYKLCFILVYRNRFSCQTIKTTFLIFLLEFSLSHLIKLTHYTNRSISQAITSVLSELVTSEVLHFLTTSWCSPCCYVARRRYAWLRSFQGLCLLALVLG